MVTHLFRNFLNNKDVYYQNIDFWKSMVYTLLSSENIEFERYLTETKPDGTLYMDGNPIYNFKVKNSTRAVRIIQEQPESESVEFAAWLNSFELSDQTIVDELVISMELSHETAIMTIDLINTWIVNKFSEQNVEKYIRKLHTINTKIFLDDKALMYA